MFGIRLRNTTPTLRYVKMRRASKLYAKCCDNIGLEGAHVYNCKFWSKAIDGACLQRPYLDDHIRFINQVIRITEEWDQ